MPIMISIPFGKSAGYILICLFNFSATSAAAQMQTIFIKKDIAVAKPVSPLLYESMIDLVFGRSKNQSSELLYNRDLVLM